MIDAFIDQLENELDYFTRKKRIKLFSPATDEAVSAAERLLGCRFSYQMKMFYKKFNGGRVFEIIIKGVPEMKWRKIPPDFDIVESNQTLRTFDCWNLSWLCLGSDGFGNYFIADLSRRLEDGEYPICFLDHETIGLEESIIEYASSYSEYLLRVVAEMKRVYMPNGDLKDI